MNLLWKFSSGYFTNQSLIFFNIFFLLCSPLCSVVHHRCERFSCRPYVEEPKRFQSVVSVLQSSLGNKKKTFDMKFTKIRYEWLYVISYLDSLKNESILISYHKPGWWTANLFLKTIFYHTLIMFYKQHCKKEISLLFSRLHSRCLIWQ